MKSSISMSNSISIVETNVYPVGNITVRGFVICTVAGSFSASL